MPRDKDRPLTNREKEKAHGSQSEQGDRPAKDKANQPEPTLYEGPEESRQQRRS